MSAYDTSTGIVLAQVRVAAKSNESPRSPTAAPGRRRTGIAKGVLIFADALQAQNGHAELLAATGGHLMVAVKGNQPTLLA
ncbi:transposase [Actinoplanes sp. NPDC026623]|uniref:transposase n=1 Tax=Actinoplanes sp. NPDC026623 TaxID=3155610 RepID=UPI0034078045